MSDEPNQRTAPASPLEAEQRTDERKVAEKPAEEVRPKWPLAFIALGLLLTVGWGLILLMGGYALFGDLIALTSPEIDPVEELLRSAPRHGPPIP